MAGPVSERSLEIKVGAFVVAAVAILVAFVLVLGNVSFGRAYEIHVDYGFSGAVQQGAPVKVSGVEIGRVSKVTFLGGGVRDDRGRPLLVRLTLSLQDRARDVVRTDTRFLVSTAGVLGEPYVEVVPGDLEGTPLEAGTTVRGVDPPRTDLLMSRMFTLLDVLTSGLTENKDALENLLTAGGGLARSLDQVLAENRDRIAAGLLDVLDAAASLKRIAAAVDGQLADGGDARVLLADARASAAVLRRELPPLLESARTGAAELARLSTLTGQLGPEDMARVRAAIGHYEQLGARLGRLTTEVEGLLGQVERGRGTVGALMQDDQIYDDLKELLRDLKAHPWKVLWKE